MVLVLVLVMAAAMVVLVLESVAAVVVVVVLAIQSLRLANKELGGCCRMDLIRRRICSSSTSVEEEGAADAYPTTNLAGLAMGMELMMMM
jgi:hypothetical protein